MTRPQVVILHNWGTPELWLCILKDGAWLPLGNTGPLRMPDDWKQALKSAADAANQRESKP